MAADVRRDLAIEDAIEIVLESLAITTFKLRTRYKDFKFHSAHLLTTSDNP